MEGLTNISTFRREEDTMTLIKEWHNDNDWRDYFSAVEDTNHFLLKCIKYAVPRINWRTWKGSLKMKLFSKAVSLSCLKM